MRRGDIANEIRAEFGFKPKEAKADYLDSFDLHMILHQIRAMKDEIKNIRKASSKK